MRYSDMWPRYAKWWDKMIIKLGRREEFSHIARMAIMHKDVYERIAKASGVPWELIAVLHRRESDANFLTYLGNGEPLTRRTKTVPKGRGPFKTEAVSWEEAFFNGALDALRIDGLTSVKNWTIEKELFYCETFNGWGYAMYHNGMPSPYVWGGTNVQVQGKYIDDGRWSAAQWDPQPGCAPILQMIAKLDPTVVFTRET